MRLKTDKITTRHLYLYHKQDILMGEYIGNILKKNMSPIGYQRCAWSIHITRTQVFGPQPYISSTIHLSPLSHPLSPLNSSPLKSMTSSFLSYPLQPAKARRGGGGVTLFPTAIPLVSFLSDGHYGVGEVERPRDRHADVYRVGSYLSRPRCFSPSLIAGGARVC